MCRMRCKGERWAKMDHVPLSGRKYVKQFRRFGTFEPYTQIFAHTAPAFRPSAWAAIG